MDWLDEIFNGGDNEQQNRTVTHAQLSKVVELIDVRKLHAREVKFAPDDSIYIGGEMASYGDWSYYITPEGEVVCTYYSIGD